MIFEKVSENKVFGGLHQQFSFNSTALNSNTRFAIFLPHGASSQRPVPVIYWLSGLTCTDENFMQKSGALRIAAELGVAIVAPDTSPRGENVPDDPNGAWDFGHGAGFYLNATQSPWDQHYQMYDFIVEELPMLVEATFPVTEARSICGHSMGGHGALSIALKNPKLYRSVSAFSPIANPSKVPWGKKAFAQYLGDDESTWEKYDTCSLLEQFHGEGVPALVDQGGNDQFLDEQLSIAHLQEVVSVTGYPMEVNIHEGYDHSYYFISSFIDAHFQFHGKFLL